MPPEIRLVALPPEAQTSPVFVSRHELTAQRVHDADQTPSTFFNHDHSVLLLHEGEPTVVEHVVHREPTAWTLRSGDVLIIPAGAPHRRKKQGHGPFTAAAFCAACLDLDDQVAAPLDRVRSGASPVVSIPEERRPHVAHLFSELLVASTPPSAPLIVLKSLLTLLLHELARFQNHPTQTGDTLVADALRFIERHCLGPLSRSDRPGLWADPGEQRRLAPSVVRHTVTNTGPIGLPVMVEVEVDGVFFRERGVLGGAVPGS